MSERPDDRRPNEPERSSGWRSAENGGWRTPEPEETSGESWREAEESREREQPSRWRVPTLPRDLTQEPERTGGWHLPKPDQTTYTPEDESVVAAEEEPSEALGEVEADAAAAVNVYEQPATSPTVTDPQSPILPFEGQGRQEEEPGALPFEDTLPPDEQATQTDVIDYLDEDEEDEDRFSMSELIALASLVENPTVSQPVQPAEAQPEAPSEDYDPNDPAAYARRQLEMLRQQQQGGGTEPIEAAPEEAAPEEEVQPTGALSPEEYARQQLERLRGGAPAEQPSAEQPAEAARELSSEEQALADQYRAAEERVRALRDQYRQGLITRDQFQEQLRQSMILDNNNVYWMLGVESDMWYKYENGQWTPAQPAVLATGAHTREEAPEAAAPADYQADYSAPATSSATENPEAWLPRQVPVTDPDATIPGTGGIFLDDDATIPAGLRPDQEATVAGATIPNPAVAVTQYEGIAAPAPAQPLEPEGESLYDQAVEEQRRRTARTIALVAAIGAAIIFLLGAILVIGVVVWYNNIADPWRQEIAALAAYEPEFQTARILAADGSLIAELTSPEGGARTSIPLENIAPELVHAVVSVENERFFEDPGFDPVAIARAFFQNLSAGEVESGASTITQQIARNLVIRDTTVSPLRKTQEIIVAAEIARQYDKNFLLELYLNEIFFGNQSYGVEAASEFYFDESAADVNLPQAALLAGLIQAPALYDPVVNRQAAFARMEEVLQQMAEVGCLQFTFAPYNETPYCITQEDISGTAIAVPKARVEAANYLPRETRFEHPHFVNYVLQQVERIYGTSELYQRGFQIRTTLLPRLQQVSEVALRQQVLNLAPNGVNTGAVMVADPRDGAIRAMVGSPDFYDEEIDGQVNGVFAWNSPGSALKPVVYAAAFDGVNTPTGRSYLTPATILWDVRTDFGNYVPVNFDREYHGPVSVRTALANSYNVPAVKALNFVGVGELRAVAERMGIDFLPEVQLNLTTAVGGTDVRLFDMTEAYATLANDGLRVPFYTITQITDFEGNEVALPPRPEPAQAISPGAAFLIQSILADNVARAIEFGTNSPLVIEGLVDYVAAKTGTSDENRDLWTMGFSSNYTVGVWIGRNDNAPIVNISGLAAAPIWNAVMREALQNTTPEPFIAPPSVVQRQVCAATGTIYDPSNPLFNCPEVRTEFFLQSAPPPGPTEAFLQAVPIDTWTGLRANELCPQSVETEIFVVLNDPAALNWLNNDPQGLAYLQSLGVTPPATTPPDQACTASTPRPQVDITNPQPGETVSDEVPVIGTAQGPNFSGYQVELAPQGTNNFVVVVPRSQNQIVNGQLGTFNSRGVQNGAYTLRLSAFSTLGGVTRDTVDIIVNNIQPTATPTPFPTLAVPTQPGVATLLPFDTLTPTPNGGFVPFGGLSPLEPTPTIVLEDEIPPPATAFAG